MAISSDWSEMSNDQLSFLALPHPSHSLPYRSRIVVDVKVRADKENVLWFEVCVGQFGPVEVLDCLDELVCDVSDLEQWVWVILVVSLHTHNKNTNKQR